MLAEGWRKLVREGLGTRQFVQPHEKKPFGDLEEVGESMCLPSSTSPRGSSRAIFLSVETHGSQSWLHIRISWGAFSIYPDLGLATPKSPGVWPRYCNFYKLPRGYYCSRIPQSETKEPTQVSD